MIRLEIPILFLEYYASGQAVCILKWGYSVAQSFSYETNWYEGTIAFTDDRSSVHVSFFIVYSVSGFTNSHYDSGVAINDGDHVVFEVNGSTEGFSESTDRNHGSPSTVDVWSSVASNNVIVYNIIGGTDGHNNTGISINIFWAKSIVQSCTIKFAVVVYYNNDFSCSFFIREEGQSAFTTGYIIVIVDDFNPSIFITLVCNITRYSTTNTLNNIAILIYNAYANFIIGISIARFTIECERVSAKFFNDGYFGFYKLRNTGIICFDSDSLPNEFFIVVNCKLPSFICFVNLFGSIGNIHYNVIEVGSGNLLFNALFINMVRNNSKIVTDSYFIIRFYIIGSSRTIFFGFNFENQILSFTEIIQSERSFCSFTAIETNLYSVLPSDKISFWIIISFIIVERVYAIIPNQFEIGRTQGRSVWLAFNTHVLRICSVACCFFTIESS